ncbi:unnamed protein product [Hymenolepis diminuta]|uniref:Uncharacterized protein n=1 Tax=Hymenolepis diminuta TaxID=6216 RepID=A0A0R3SW13_HYMDI|nr:unnamed protein product [Hymenolepis diminuta]
MTSSKAIDFEWDLSKENVRPLSTGRSVPQLNMVLAFQKSPIFAHWCNKIRKYLL